MNRKLRIPWNKIWKFPA